MDKSIRTYKKLLQTYPLLVQSVQTGVLMGTGDMIAQGFIEGRSLKNLDTKRTITFCGLGTCLVGPTLVTWYKTLSIIVKGSSKAVVLKKVALDQLCFSPTFIGCFLCTLGFVQGYDFQQIKQNVSKNYKDILLTNYQIWPLVQLGNFYLTPLHYQTLVVQGVAICWNTYISWKTQS
ncbi:hypothetical protein HHI36_005428 [Cryptolaemus montrouzieri]|uniref:Mitochondrial inner membrane protein Mpv17 n=1 Tax=Cryptolaemus montrouzieri TaxID=559131 RepID=A0ABD2NUM2_9CUCU